MKNKKGKTRPKWLPHSLEKGSKGFQSTLRMQLSRCLSGDISTKRLSEWLILNSEPKLKELMVTLQDAARGSVNGQITQQQFEDELRKAISTL